jgi:hypothetical protein
MSKSFFFNGVFNDSFYVYNYNFIKKKNPLNLTTINAFIMTFNPRSLHFYFFNKYFNKTVTTSSNAAINNNYVVVYSNEQEQLATLFQNESNLILLLTKGGNSFFTSTLSKKHQNFSSFIVMYAYKRILHTLMEIYKIFIFLFLQFY